jgi:hypothetical protein
VILFASGKISDFEKRKRLEKRLRSKFREAKVEP